MNVLAWLCERLTTKTEWNIKFFMDSFCIFGILIMQRTSYYATFFTISYR